MSEKNFIRGFRYFLNGLHNRWLREAQFFLEMASGHEKRTIFIVEKSSWMKCSLDLNLGKVDNIPFEIQTQTRIYMNVLVMKRTCFIVSQNLYIDFSSG